MQNEKYTLPDEKLELNKKRLKFVVLKQQKQPFNEKYHR